MGTPCSESLPPNHWIDDYKKKDSQGEVHHYYFGFYRYIMVYPLGLCYSCIKTILLMLETCHCFQLYPLQWSCLFDSFCRANHPRSLSIAVLLQSGVGCHFNVSLVLSRFIILIYPTGRKHIISADLCQTHDAFR